jgi:glycosyltransferase involved in cell wall biosynthesis
MTAAAGEARPAPRLLLVISSLMGGGAERQLADMASYWASKGLHVTLATWSGPQVPDFYSLAPGVARLWLDVRVAQHWPLVRNLSTISRLFRLRRELRVMRPDAVLSFVDITNVCVILAAMGLGLHVVVAERTHPALNRTTSWPWRALRRILYSRAAQVVAQTQDAATWITEKCRARVAVIPNLLRNLPQVSCVREPLLVGIGRLSYEKGFDLLLKAFARVSPQFPAWRLCIIGEGVERGALLQLREELALTKRAEFVGEVREVEGWMARASLVIHPSRREGFPNVVLEAMGMGAAVICASCHSGLAELVEDDVNGRLVAVDDVDALARVMAELMGNPNTRERLGRKACEVRRRFEQSAIMGKWEACLLPRRLTPAEPERH